MIKIIGDSTCDLDEKTIERYNLELVPLNVIIEGKSYKDRMDITNEEFYEVLRNSKKNPTTSMPSPEEFLRHFKKIEEEGYKQILCICMSSGTSGSYQSAKIAEDYFYENNKESDLEIKIIDSYSMSLGSGWLIMKAAQLLEKGLSFDELIEYCERKRKNVKHFLCVDDLDNLIKSGRLNNAAGFVGKILNIKPIMTMDNTKGTIVTKLRGWKRVMKYYIDEFKKRVDLNETNFINIGYTDNISLAEELKDRLIRETEFKGDIYIMQKGAAVGTHVGSGGLSMFYMEK